MELDTKKYSFPLFIMFQALHKISYKQLLFYLEWPFYWRESKSREFE